MRFPLCRTDAYCAGTLAWNEASAKGSNKARAHGQDGSGFQPDAPDLLERTMKKHLIALSLAATALSAAPAFARDDGPRFAQDLLDALVAQHAAASQSIAGHAAKASPTRAEEASAPPRAHAPSPGAAS